MRYSVCLYAVWLLGFCAAVCPAYAGDGDHLLPVAGTQWKGRKVAFMGDSITDKAHVGTTKNYWQYLQEMLGLVPFVYGINGQQWRDVPGQCEKLRAERGGDIDAILIFAGTNDFNSGTPLGEWYTTGEVPVEVSGPRSEIRTRRTLSMDGDTFRGDTPVSGTTTSSPTNPIPTASASMRMPMWMRSRRLRTSGPSPSST